MVSKRRSPRRLILALGLTLLTALALGAGPASAAPIYSFALEFGEEGSGNGQFKEATDVAIDPEGNVYVADSANNRVQKFNAAGEYQSQFGTEGSGNGQFKNPWDVAVGPGGNVYVLDLSNDRIQKFSAAGEYLNQFGKAQITLPLSITTDSKGNVYASSFGTANIQKFNAAGEYQSQFGSGGSGEGQLKGAMGLAADPEDNIAVADTGNDRVLSFDAAGKYEVDTGWQHEGIADPRGVAIGSNTLWVVSATHVEKWTTPITQAPEFLPVGEEFPLSFTVTGGEATIPGFPPIVCSSSIGSGAFMNGHEGTITLTYQKCQMSFGSKCTSPGLPEGNPGLVHFDPNDIWHFW